MSIGFTLHFDRQSGFKVDFALTDIPELNNITRGERTTIQFKVPPPTSSLTVSGGDTYTVSSGTAEQYTSVDNDGTLNIEDNATLVVEDSIDNDGTIDNDGVIKVGTNFLGVLRDYDAHAGSYSTRDSLSNTVRYREQIPDNPSNINNLIVGIEPDSELQDNGIDGVWGLIDNVSDTRTRALTNDSVEVELTILATWSEYANTTAVQNNLEITV